MTTPAVTLRWRGDALFAGSIRIGDVSLDDFPCAENWVGWLYSLNLRKAVIRRGTKALAKHAFEAEIRLALTKDPTNG